MSLPKLPIPRAIIFDWDNTIADTWTIINKALNLTFKEFDLPEWSLEETKQKVALSMRDAFPKYFGSRTEQASTIYRNHYIDHAKTLYEIFDGVKEMLALAQQKNILLAVVSNKSGDILRQEIKSLKLDAYFHRVVGAMDANNDKPHIDPVLLALTDSGIKPQKDVWFVGDSIIDMECAYNSQCTPIFYGEVSDLKSFHPFIPKHSILNHYQLIDLLNNIEHIENK